MGVRIDPGFPIWVAVHGEWEWFPAIYFPGNGFARRFRRGIVWRLWAGFGDWDWTKVKDVTFDSLFCRIYRACKEAFSWTGNKNFRDRMRLVQWLEVRTITGGWTDGLGPNEKPYWMCCSDELFGDACCIDAPLAGKFIGATLSDFWA